MDIVEALFFKFYQDVLKTYVDITQFGMEEGIEVDNTPKELVKRVSDVVWSLLSGNYKADTPHIQSLYMYLTGEVKILFHQILNHLFNYAFSSYIRQEA